MGGMALVFKEGTDADMPPIPDDFPTCGFSFSQIKSQQVTSPSTSGNIASSLITAINTTNAISTSDITTVTTSLACKVYSNAKISLIITVILADYLKKILC